MALARIKRNYQITIPNSLRKQLKISEGDYLEIESQQGKLVMKPAKLIHPDHEYFYTKEWQKGEAEADEDIKKGRLAGPFDNIEDLLKELKS